LFPTIIIFDYYLLGENRELRIAQRFSQWVEEAIEEKIERTKDS